MDYASIALQVAIHAPGVVFGLFVGAWGYRYMLKKNPAGLEALVQEWNSKVTAAESKVSSVVSATAAAQAVAATTPTTKT